MRRYFDSKTHRVYSVEPGIGGGKYMIFYRDVRKSNCPKRTRIPILYEQVGKEDDVQHRLDGYAKLMGWTVIYGGDER